MIYITTKQYRKPKQLTWEDVIADNVILSEYSNEISNTTGTVTRKYETIDTAISKKIDTAGMIKWLKRFNEDNEELFNTDRKALFHSFKIPKNSGGFRDIDEPLEPLMSQLYRLTSFLKESCGLLYHTAAFAYVEGRSIADCDMKHIKNKSNWYLKTDFSGFFPHTNLDFVMKMLSMVFPTSEICKDEEGYRELRKALSLNYKANGDMPQGSPLSPFITNTICIPIDHKLFNEFANRKMVYTRYADDMCISAEAKFPWQNCVEIIKETLKEFGAPYEIKKEKTRFGSVKGRNWNLGLMCCRDGAEYRLTVGAKKKRYFKAALCSFILDTKHGKHWDIGDVQHLRGQLSYYRMIEPEYFDDVVAAQNKKWNVDVYKLFKKYL